VYTIESIETVSVTVTIDGGGGIVASVCSDQSCCYDERTQERHEPP
jgi:hypothetical protein